MKEIIQTAKAPAPIGPYSQAVKVGNVLYMSGQIALIPGTGDLNNTDINAEAHQVLKNIGEVLQAAGMNYENVVKTQIFLKNLDDFAIVNEIYGQYFVSHHPARDTVQVAKLPKDVKVEISCIAVK
ncbi:MAG: RidA family protein [Cytophagales bacterium]|nr:RidA family protein [Cytophagales bacterium]